MMQYIERKEFFEMKVYQCSRCASVFDYVNKKSGRLCDHCAAPLAFHGEEVSPWGENPHLKDYDAPQGAL